MSGLTDLTVCVFNVGSGTSDYFQLCKYKQPELKFSSREEEAAFKVKYATAEEATNASFLSQQIDAYCLQEAGHLQRPLLLALKKKGFHLVHCALDIFDTAIALQSTRFKDVENHSTEIEITPQYKKDVAIATATDSLTGRRIAFISAHAPGFDFSLRDVSKEAQEGDIYCKQIIKTALKIKDCKLHIFGADMNANPEIWNKRFKKFSDEGFQLFRTRTPTNVNSRDSIHTLREIDFLFVREEPKSARSKAAEKGLQVILKLPDLLGWDPEKNCSDHQPVIFSLSI